MYIQMTEVSPSACAAEEGLYMLGPFFSTCLSVLRLVSGSLFLHLSASLKVGSRVLEPEKP